MDDVLTVLIPTFNRKSSLLKLLWKLELQTVQNFYVLISDNASNYSIEEEIIPRLSKSFIPQISIYRRKYNIGAWNNIAGLFSLCETKWGWVLSDDDNIYYDSIEKIYDLIHNNKEIGGFWFSLVETSFNGTIIRSLEEYIQLEEKLASCGDAIFVSNKVFNMEIVQKYVYKTNLYAYTVIPHCIPIFEMLKEHINFMVVFNNIIVKHGGFKNGVTWDVRAATLGIRTIMDYETNLTWKDHRRFVKCVMFPWRNVIRLYLMSDGKKWDYGRYLKIVYDNCYKYILSLPERITMRLLICTSRRKKGYQLMKKIYAVYRNMKNK